LKRYGNIALPSIDRIRKLKTDLIFIQSNVPIKDLNGMSKNCPQVFVATCWDHIPTKTKFQKLAMKNANKYKNVVFDCICPNMTCEQNIEFIHLVRA